MTVSTVATALLPTAAAIVVGLALLVYLVWCAVSAFKRLFGDSWGRTLAKSAAIGFVYLTAYGAVAFLLLGYALTRM